jgi:hypothetical protein
VVDGLSFLGVKSGHQLRKGDTMVKNTLDQLEIVLHPENIGNRED